MAFVEFEQSCWEPCAIHLLPYAQFDGHATLMSIMTYDRTRHLSTSSSCRGVTGLSGSSSGNTVGPSQWSFLPSTDRAMAAIMMRRAAWLPSLSASSSSTMGSRSAVAMPPGWQPLGHHRLFHTSQMLFAQRHLNEGSSRGSSDSSNALRLPSSGEGHLRQARVTFLSSSPHHSSAAAPLATQFLQPCSQNLSPLRLSMTKMSSKTGSTRNW